MPFRGVDQNGQVIDVVVSQHRDTPSARRFFTMPVVAHRVPIEVISDRTASIVTGGQANISEPAARQRRAGSPDCPVLRLATAFDELQHAI